MSDPTSLEPGSLPFLRSMPPVAISSSTAPASQLPQGQKGRQRQEKGHWGLWLWFCPTLDVPWTHGRHPALSEPQSLRLRTRVQPIAISSQFLTSFLLPPAQTVCTAVFHSVDLPGVMWSSLRSVFMRKLRPLKKKVLVRDFGTRAPPLSWPCNPSQPIACPKTSLSDEEASYSRTSCLGHRDNFPQERIHSGTWENVSILSEGVWMPTSEIFPYSSGPLFLMHFWFLIFPMYKLDIQFANIFILINSY